MGLPSSAKATMSMSSIDVEPRAYARMHASAGAEKNPPNRSPSICSPALRMAAGLAPRRTARAGRSASKRRASRLPTRTRGGAGVPSGRYTGAGAPPPQAVVASANAPHPRTVHTGPAARRARRSIPARASSPNVVRRVVMA